MSEIAAFELPDLGEGLDEASIVEWRINVGDTVVLNQPLIVVETAKAEMELPSPYAGTVIERRGEPGDTIAVGSVLVRIEVSDLEPVSRAETGEIQPEHAPVLVGYGPSDRPPQTRTALPAKPMCSPPVRKLARDLGVDLVSLIPGSGPDGHIVRADVERAAATTHDDSATVIPLRGIRARTAERMMTSRREIPDATAATWADATNLLALRDRLLNDPGRGGTRLTPFTLILRLLVLTLGEHPVLNATLDTEADEIRVHPLCHLGVATATPNGLVVPVIKNASDRTTIELAAELERLSNAAREGKLSPAELRGSTFTVSNFGAFGIDDGVPVINHPEVAILGVGAIRVRPWVIDDELTTRHTVKLTCAFDHRVCDGADAAGFLRQFADLVEQPERAWLRL